MEVLVTRAAGDAERTARQLRALGFQAVIAPVTRIVATENPLPEGAWDALIVTSLHAAAALSTLAGRAIPVFAVGPRTAEAVRHLGFEKIHIAGGDAVSLAGLIRRECAPTSNFLHVTAKHHKAEPAASMRAEGFTVTHWLAYEAEAAGSLPEAAVVAIRAGRIGAALHYSRRSAEIFLRLAQQEDLIPALSAVPHLCLSKDVAEPLREAGFGTRVAPVPDEAALFRLLQL